MENTIVCDDDAYNSYADIYSHLLPSYAVSKDSRRECFYKLKKGYVVEAFDVEAESAIQNGIANYWYPLFKITAVIAVDRDLTDSKIGNWHDLLLIDESVALAEHIPQEMMLFMAVAYGLDGEDFTLNTASSLFATLQTEKRLLINSFTAPVIICFDYQAAAMISKGRNLEVVIPEDGSLSYEKGLLSKEELYFEPDTARMILDDKYYLTDGISEYFHFPGKEAYLNASTVNNYQHFNSRAHDYHRTVRRIVLNNRRYSSADTREHQFFALIYMVLLFFYLRSLIIRARNKNILRIVVYCGITLLMWMFLRLIKYQLVGMPSMERYLWYLFYLFQLTLPLLLLYWAWLIDKPSDLPPLSRIFKITIFINILLFILVISNDLHSLVFRINFNLSGDIASYQYGPAFYILMFVCVLEITSAIILLLKKRSSSPRRWTIVFPLAFTALLLTYSIAYLKRIPFAWESDYSMVVGIFSMLFMETSLQSGMITSNTKYSKFFVNSPLKMQLLDSAGNVVLSSQFASEILPEMRQQALDAYPQSIKLNRDTLLYACEVTGGYAHWQEDIYELNVLHAEIEASVANLKMTNAILSEDKVINDALNEEKRKIEILQQLETEISKHSYQLAKSIKELELGAKSIHELVNAALLLCYIKRRSNIFFRKQESSTIRTVELKLLLEELAELSVFADVHILVVMHFETDICISNAKIIYDFLFDFCDWQIRQQGNHYRECSILVQVSKDDDFITIAILSSCDLNSYIPDQEILDAIKNTGGSMKNLTIDDNYAIHLKLKRKDEDYA